MSDLVLGHIEQLTTEPETISIPLLPDGKWYAIPGTRRNVDVAIGGKQMGMIERHARAYDPMAWKFIDDHEHDETPHPARELTIKRTMESSRNAIISMLRPTDAVLAQGDPETWKDMILAILGEDTP